MVRAAEFFIAARHRRDRFDALALGIAEETDGVERERLTPVAATENRANLVEVAIETALAGRYRGGRSSRVVADLRADGQESCGCSASKIGKATNSSWTTHRRRAPGCADRACSGDSRLAIRHRSRHRQTAERAATSLQPHPNESKNLRLHAFDTPPWVGRVRESHRFAPLVHRVRGVEDVVGSRRRRRRGQRDVQRRFERRRGGRLGQCRLRQQLGEWLLERQRRHESRRWLWFERRRRRV